MRVLHVNKFLYRRGGAEAYLLEVAQHQRDAGHDVEFFAMSHPANEPSTYSTSFPPHLDFNGPASPRTNARRALRMLWSRSAERGMAEVLDAFRPDVVHLHNVYHQLSPSVLRPVRARGVPAVMTVHDYKLVCPTYQLLAGDEPCTACLDGHVRHAPARRCKNGSVLASAAAAFETAFHRQIGAWDAVSILVCPSRFAVSVLSTAPHLAPRARHIPNFVTLDDGDRAPDAEPAPSDHPSIAYIGRLSREKGVDVLVAAIRQLDDVTLTVVGDGPAAGDLRRDAADLANVTFTGALTRPDVLRTLAASDAVVVPSRWYENQPMVVLEAFASGRPVIASAIGGLSELVEDGDNGLLVRPGDAMDLERAIRQLLDSPGRGRGAGARGRALVHREHSAARHLERLAGVYGEAADAVRAVT